MVGIIAGVPLSEFFPYGPSANDEIFPANDDGSTSALPLPRLFPYFNNNHRQIYLSNNGLFSFLGPIYEFIPTPFPLSDDRRLIAGFWSDIDTRGNISSGNLVYYKIFGNESGNITFEKASRYVAEYFPGERSFNPKMVITGTWYRVGAFFCQTNLTNTFQIVLVTDEIRSFAFILYHELEWASPRSVSMNESIMSQNETGGQAGFNAGDGVTSKMLPYSRTGYVRRLANLSNVDVPGLFVFRIDTDTIIIGGCGNNSNLLYRPRRGSQLGLTPITIQGPCFSNLNSSNIKCRFGESIIVDGIIINEYEAICLTPFVSLPSFTNIYLSIDGGITFVLFPYLFSYTSVEYGISSGDDAQVILLNKTDIILSIGDELNLGWYLSETTMNNWLNSTMEIEIEMCIVTLNEFNGGINKNSCTNLKRNLIPIIGFQSTLITIPSIVNINLPVIYFRVILRDNLTNQIYVGLNSLLFVLYNNRMDTTNYCQSWSSTQPSPITWNDNLFPCPLTLTQARVARCCYEIDPLCIENSYNPLINCRLHQGRSQFNEQSAIACYLSRTTNQWNAGSECCYDSFGQLITRGRGGGTDDRYQPSTLPNRHFFGDILPYFACCLLNSHIELCERYFNSRPHRRGSNSRNGGGGTWGDPHFITLDGTLYSFNGYGEYTYLAITDSPNTPFDSSTQDLIFNSQIRTTTLNSSNDNATVIRGFSAKSNDSSAERISITVSRREMLIIRRGNETIDIDISNDDTISTNNSLIILYPEMIFERNQTNGVITLSWFIGISIQITPILITNSLILNIDVSISGLFQNRTFGLLGLYDNNPLNDLRSQDGIVIDSNSTLEQIHYQFGITWAINPNHSLFYYENNDYALSYTNQNLRYIPLFTFPQLSQSQINIIYSVCNINPLLNNQSTWTIDQQTCYYDIAMTNDTTLGQTSRLAAQNQIQISVDQRYPPEFNSHLPLSLIVNDSTVITINFTAMSPYSSNIIYNLIEGPSSSNFNRETAIFNWKITSSNGTDTIIRVSAQDTRYYLLSTHEIVLRVIPETVENTTLPSNANIISFKLILIFINIIHLFLF